MYTCVGKSLGEQVRREFVAVRGDGIEHTSAVIPVVARNCTVSVIASRSRMAVRHGMSTRSAARATLSAALA